MVVRGFSPARTAPLVYQPLLVLLGILGLTAAAAGQTTVTLAAPGSEINADTTIRGGGHASVDHSTSEVLESKNSDASYTRRILMKFDTENVIPQGVVINSATLYLVLKSANSNTERPLTAFRVGKSFVTRQATWLNYRDGLAWNAQGGDLTERFTTTYVGNAVGSTYAIDLTQLVQKTVNGDYGSRYTRLALVDTGQPTKASYREFHSTRASNSAVRPRLVISYGAPASTASASSSSPSGTTIRVMQWNIHKSMGTDGKCSPSRIADWVVKLGPQIVSMNEVSYYKGTCSYTADLGATLESLLEQMTGIAWYRNFVNATGSSSGVGNLILSVFPFTSSSTHLLSYERGVVQVGVVVNGRNINLFSTHVDYYNSSYRTIQTNEVKAWIGTFATPRILMGDFNTWPGTSDYQIIASSYLDAWVQAKTDGTATSYNGTGATRGASRFDYAYYSSGSWLVLKSVNVPDTRTSGVFPSDHDPVVAVFHVE
jgi:endonuclease/exonuclease/phosphatase family metal-dependent hydrolase